jgi:hypothetical protein
MGMAITSSTAGASQTGAAAWQQNQQSFAALAKALKSGDLSSAQSAYAALTTNKASANNPNSPLAQLGQALNSGDLTGAQKALAAMRSAQASNSSAANANTPPTTPNPTLTSGNSVNTYV